MTFIKIVFHWKHLLYLCETRTGMFRMDYVAIQDDFGFLVAPNVEQFLYSLNGSQEEL